MSKIELPAKIEKLLDAYRKQRKAETGKLPFRQTAIEELLLKALIGIEQEKPVSDRLEDLRRKLLLLEDRLDAVEDKVFERPAEAWRASDA